MTRPFAVIETGPAAIRRIWPAAGPADIDAATVETALDCLDDATALVDERPVSVDTLWRTAMQSLCATRQPRAHGPVVVVHPSWWAASRVARVAAAARTVTDEVATHSRAWVLATAAPAADVVVEITPRLVVVTGAAVVAEPRTGQERRVVAAVAERITATAAGIPTTVRIDAPGTVDGAVVLAAAIADRVRGADLTAEVVDDARRQPLTSAVLCTELCTDGRQTGVGPVVPAAPRRRGRIRAAVSAAGVVTVAALCGVGTCERCVEPAGEAVLTTFLVEGRITLQVPAQWPVQRITTGPGSARVVVTSPSDPQVALHVTQSLVTDETLSATAESLTRAIAAEPAGVFVDFDPVAHRAGRTAVTYRELRPGHDIGWTILLDGGVRISIGCQSPAGGADAVGDVCDQAVRSAHRLG